MNNQHKNNQINHTGFTAYNKVKYGLKSFFLTRHSSSFTAYVKGKEYDVTVNNQNTTPAYLVGTKTTMDMPANNKNTTPTYLNKTAKIKKTMATLAALALLSTMLITFNSCKSCDRNKELVPPAPADEDGDTDSDSDSNSDVDEGGDSDSDSGTTDTGTKESVPPAPVDGGDDSDSDVDEGGDTDSGTTFEKAHYAASMVASNGLTMMDLLMKAKLRPELESLFWFEYIYFMYARMAVQIECIKQILVGKDIRLSIVEGFKCSPISQTKPTGNFIEFDKLMSERFGNINIDEVKSAIEILKNDENVSNEQFDTFIGCLGKLPQLMSDADKHYSEIIRIYGDKLKQKFEETKCEEIKCEEINLQEYIRDHKNVIKNIKNIIKEVSLLLAKKDKEKKKEGGGGGGGE